MEKLTLLIEGQRQSIILCQFLYTIQYVHDWERIGFIYRYLHTGLIHPKSRITDNLYLAEHSRNAHLEQIASYNDGHFAYCIINFKFVSISCLKPIHYSSRQWITHL